MAEHLPINILHDPVLIALEEGPVVISSPTGSGKSTQVPRWCPGPVLVVEPRRVACRALASRVAELEGVTLGKAVGYQVRDEHRANNNTRILFATPGVALRLADRWDHFATIVVDEFHERSLEIDLLLALLLGGLLGGRLTARLLVMSATLDGDRVAQHLGGQHLHADGRTFPVKIDHLDGGVLLPEVRGLEERVARALTQSPKEEGDVLIFLPGKGEIRNCAERLGKLSGITLLELHGGLSLEQQSRIFRSTSGRKVVLTTNVAETSLTVPGIGLVIDSGLVRRTRYHRGRGFLTLVPVASDSAEQRAGRAGRTTSGRCVRLWSAVAQLENRTPPAVYRESLVPLVLAAAACGEQAKRLPFFDPPHEHALEAAHQELHLLDALNAEGTITSRGHKLFGLPLDLSLSRLLVEAETHHLLDDMIDLVACLAAQRPLLNGHPNEEDLPRDDPSAGCDATHLIRALRGDPLLKHLLNRGALEEVRWLRKRLRRLYNLPGEGATHLNIAKGATHLNIDRKRLALAVLAADPRAAYIARQRSKRVTWANGGTEIELGRESAVGLLEGVEAMVVLATRALGLGQRETRLLATHAMPVPVDWLLEAGLGRDRLGRVQVQDDRVITQIERVHARRVLSTREEIPEGNMARQAMAQLFLEGRLFRKSLNTTRERLRVASLAWHLARQEQSDWLVELQRLHGDEPPEDLEQWVLNRLQTLGVESGEDLALLSPEDLLAPDLPAHQRQELDRRFPRQLKLPGATYDLEYNLSKGQVILHQTTGRRLEVPPPTYLPVFRGLRVRLEFKGTHRTLR
jgi:ATP-dependent helicase HrpB